MKSKPEDYQYELNTTTGYGIIVYLECWKDDSYYYLKMEGVGEDDNYTHTFKTKLYELDEDDNAFADVSIFRLSDFMEEVNDQHLDNLENYFISYIHINLEL